jgi:hypothetical protein
MISTNGSHDIKWNPLSVFFGHLKPAALYDAEGANASTAAMTFLPTSQYYLVNSSFSHEQLLASLLVV